MAFLCISCISVSKCKRKCNKTGEALAFYLDGKDLKELHDAACIQIYIRRSKNAGDIHFIGVWFSCSRLSSPGINAPMFNNNTSFCCYPFLLFFLARQTNCCSLVIVYFDFIRATVRRDTSV